MDGGFRRGRRRGATTGTHGALSLLVLLGVLSAGAGTALAQDLEPRRWTQLPVGTNILGVGYEIRTGDIRFDPALRISDATFTLHTAAVAYNHYFDLWGRTARFDCLIPVQTGEWRGMVNGERASVSRRGLADPRIRFSVNLIGGASVSAEDYAEYIRSQSERTTIGAALSLYLPLGDYDDDKLINLGQNRFTIRPQLGVLHTRGPWSFELTGSTFFYTENDDFFGDNSLEQDPLFGMQAHVVRTLGGGFWLSGGVAYAWGGETQVNGIENDDARSNLLYGLSFGVPVSGNQSLRVGYIRSDTRVDTGADSHCLFLSWTLRF